MSSPQIMNLVISMAILVGLGFIAACIFGTATRQKRNRKAPRLGAEVHVGPKRMVKSVAKNEYYIKFRLKDDELMELPVPEDTYNQLQEGDYVKVVFKGDVFEGFTRLAEPEQETAASAAEDGTESAE